MSRRRSGHSSPSTRASTANGPQPAAGRAGGPGRRLRRRPRGQLDRAPGDAPRTCCVVACAGYSDQALVPDRRAPCKQRPGPAGGRALHGLAERLRPPGVRGRRRRHRRRCRPDSADEREQSCSRSRRRSPAGSGAAHAAASRPAPMICVLGPEGRHRQDAHLRATSRSALAEDGHSGRRSSTSTCSSATSGSRSGSTPERTIYDLATSGGSLDAEKLDAYLATHESGVRVLLAPARPDQASAVTVEFLRELYAMLRSTHDYVDRRHAARASRPR